MCVLLKEFWLSLQIQSEDYSCWSIQGAAISGDAGFRQQPSVHTEPFSFGWPGQTAGNTVSWVYTQTEILMKKIEGV